MHELAIATDLIDVLLRIAAEHGAVAVTSARLRIGAASCVNPDSLRFGFEALAAGTAAAGCQLEFARTPAAGRCGECAWEGEVMDLAVLACPACGAHPVTVTGGSDLVVETLTVE